MSLQLEPSVRSIVGIDSSRRMLDMFEMKIAERKLKKIDTMLVNPDDMDALAGNYDLVSSNMTLHLVKELEPLFDRFHKFKAPGGFLCIVDLDLDDGRFHDDNTGVFHFGFDRAAMREFFTKAGFEDVRDTHAAEIVKPCIDGETRRFTVFLVTGRKRSD